jgi:hypothetical protein
MFSKEEKKEFKVAFWNELNDKLTEAGKAKGRNIEWLSYPTQIKRLFFRMEADETSARLCIDLQFVTKGIREIYYLQFQDVEDKLKNAFTADVKFVADLDHWNGKTISRIYCELEDVNINNKEDWPKIHDFLMTNFLNLDAFWEEFNELFYALKN